VNRDLIVVRERPERDETIRGLTVEDIVQGIEIMEFQRHGCLTLHVICNMLDLHQISTVTDSDSAHSHCRYLTILYMSERPRVHQVQTV
jgi:hypothetical protein